jgi:hypothetical protein
MRHAYKYSIFLLLLSSCLTSRNAPRRQAEIALRFPDVFAAAANRFLPCKDSLGSSDTLIVTDTAFLPGQVIEVRCPPNAIDTVRIRTVCPPARVVTNTVYIRDSFYILDSRGIADLQGKLANAEKQVAVSKSKEERHHGGLFIPWWWLVIIGLIVTGGFILKLKKII